MDELERQSEESTSQAKEFRSTLETTVREIYRGQMRAWGSYHCLRGGGGLQEGGREI